MVVVVGSQAFRINFGLGLVTRFASARSHVSQSRLEQLLIQMRDGFPTIRRRHEDELILVFDLSLDNSDAMRSDTVPESTHLDGCTLCSQ